jgi:hypothetical protein
VSHRSPRWLALTTFILSMVLAACGSSSGGSPSTVVAPPGATPSATAAASAARATTTPTAVQSTTAGTATCPSAATVGTALGVTLSAPIGVKGGGGKTLPAGATGVACEYAGTAFNVIIELISNIDPTSISLYSSRFPVPYSSVSGIGDQARSFRQTLGAGKDNEGVVATKGSNLVSITATATPATLAQLEALVSQLL